MTKKELKAAQDSEIIMDFVRTHERIAVDSNLLGKPIKMISKHLEDLDAEMLRRGLLTQEQIDKLNM